MHHYDVRQHHRERLSDGCARGFSQRNILIAALSLSIGIGFTQVSDIFVIFPELVRSVFADNCVAGVFLVAVIANLVLPKTLLSTGLRLRARRVSQSLTPRSPAKARRRLSSLFSADAVFVENEKTSSHSAKLGCALV